MKTTMLRAIPAAIAVLAITAGAAAAAVAMSERAPAAAEEPIEEEPIEEVDDSGRRGDDVAAPDEEPGDGRSHSDDDRTGSAIEDRPLRHEVREDRDRREVRSETRQTGSHTYPVAQAGSVTVARHDAALTVTAVVASPGWTSHVERSNGVEVEVTFRRDGQRVDFRAEFEHDRVKTRVRER